MTRSDDIERLRAEVVMRGREAGEIVGAGIREVTERWPDPENEIRQLFHQALIATFRRDLIEVHARCVARGLTDEEAYELCDEMRKAVRDALPGWTH